MRIERIRNPSSSRCARMRPVRLRAMVSGLMMASVYSMASTCEELADDLGAREQAGELALADDGELLDVLVDHQAGCLVQAHVGRDAEHGARHDLAHRDGRKARAAALFACTRDLRQEGAHDVDFRDDAEDLALFA